MKKLVVVCFAIFVSAPVHAAHWVVDYGKSRLGFSVPWQDQPFEGQFKSWKAVIEFDPANLANANAIVNVDVASVSSDEPGIDANLKGPQGFDSTRFSTAKFASKTFHASGENHYTAQGMLDLHGINKPVTLNFVLQMRGNTAHMTGTADIVRTDFGIGMGEFAKDTPVGRKVTVKIDLTAAKQP